MLRKKLEFITIIQYAFVFVSILQCNTVFFREVGSHQKLVTILWVMLTITLWGIANLNFLKQKFDLRKLIIFELVWTILVIIFLSINYSRSSISVVTIGTLFIPFFMVPIFLDDFNKKSNLLLKFRNVVVILAVISLFFWMFSMLGVPTTTSTLINWGRVRVIFGYFKLHFIAQGSIDFLGLNEIVRNTGIFVEAPMYSYVLSLALIIDMLLDTESKSYSKKSILLIITIFTTTSSTGIILVLLTIFSRMMFLTNRISKGMKLIVILILLPLLMIIISYVVRSKLDSNWYSSTSIRINDFVAGFQAWKNHYFFGNGINNYNSIIQNMDYRRFRIGASAGFSSGLMEVLAYGGITFGLYFLAPVILLFKKSKVDFIVAVLTFILFAFTLVNNVFLWYIFISYFWAILLSQDKKRKLEI